MSGLFLWAGAALLALLPPAYGMDVSDCADADPANYEDVYKCVSAFRFPNGRSRFEASFSRPSTACWGIGTIYAGALRASGVMANAADPRARGRLPSCKILAKVRKDWAGEPPSWEPCLTFDPSSIKTHMAGCLTGYLKGLKGGGRETFGPRDATRYLPNCEKTLDTYERALKDASMGRELPTAYERPDCALVAGVLTTMQTGTLAEGEEQAEIAAQWGACLDYEPENVTAHIEQCMSGHTAGIVNCATLINVYERRLREAYGGSFPVNYIRPKCFDAADMVEAEKIAMEERRRQADEFYRRMMAAREAKAPPPTWEEIGADIARGAVIVIRESGKASKAVGKAGAQIIWGGLKELVTGEE